MPQALKNLIIVLLLALSCQKGQSLGTDLPALGDRTAAIVSKEDEAKIAGSVRMALNRQADLNRDPLIYVYFSNLVGELAFHSPLTDKQIELFVIESKDFNAFAAPGNIMGINLGLLLYSNTEDELASVIAHEIGHLSQKHYARSIERQKSQQYLGVASLIAGILATAGGQADAGLATITAGRAAAIEQQLKYSRLDEQEADRVGIRMLSLAGMNPQAAANMFQHMQFLIRYREDLQQFSFLLTHPLTESRVADALNQARAYPVRADRDSLDFHLMKARAFIQTQGKNSHLISHFKSAQHKYPSAAAYGLALAYLKENNTAAAQPVIDKLYTASPHKTAYIVIKADLLLQRKQPAAAIALLKKHLVITPDSYPLSVTLIKAYEQAGKPGEAARLQADIIRKMPFPPVFLIYELAELQGLSGNIKALHRTRADYFISVGAYKEAKKHLNLALEMEKNNKQARAAIRQRLQTLERLIKDSPLKSG